MITRVSFKNFKGFSKYAVDLSRLNLLVGGNNSGKTTIFHALQLIFWCIERTVDVSDSQATFRKTQVAQIGALPYFTHRDIFHRQQVQSGRETIKIELEIETDATPALHFSIYRAFSRNLMIDGADQKLTRAQYERLIAMKPVYIAGAVGITVQEEYLRAVSQQRLIAEGRQNQVLRNLVYRLRQGGEWDAFTKFVSPLFALQGMDVPFDVEKDEWLSATYEEDGCQFDRVSAGSGFLQTINLLCFLFLNESRTALLDEPDSHMHDDLQRLVFDALSELSAQRKLQLIIATHSPTMIDAAGLDSVRLVDRKQEKPLVAQSVDTLIPLLSDQGLSLPPNKVLETLRVRRALFVEGLEADYNAFVAAIGEVRSPGFGARARGLNVFETGGASKKWPFDAIACFEKLLGADLQYVYLSDRDFLTDEEVQNREAQAETAGSSIVHLERRHRESYLLEPRVLARVLAEKWQKSSAAALPSDLQEASLRRWIVGKAKELEDSTRSTLQVEHEAGLRGDSQHRTAGLMKLNEYFRGAYTEPLGRNDIPYKLLDAKAVLRALRSEIAERFKISFSDVELFKTFNASEVPADLGKLIDRILKMFPAAPAGQKPKGQSTSATIPATTRSNGAGKRGSPQRSEKAMAIAPNRVAATKKPAPTAPPPTALKAADVDLNENEVAVLRVLASSLEGLHLTVVGKKAFPRVPEAKAYSWARNSVRKPLKMKLITMVSRGTYKCTAAGLRAAGS